MASLSLSLQKHPLPSLLPRQSPKPLSSSSHNLFILPKSSHSHFYGTVKLSYPPSLSLPSSNSSSRKQTLIFAKVNKGGVPPSFTLKDQEGRNVTLSKFKGKPVVVYFYPADETPGCTKQAFAKKYRLPYTLLSDEGNKIRKEWGVPADLFGTLPGRQTYVLDKNGVVQLIYNNQFQPEKHIDETLKILQSI
ncbi:peroxiredoxin Q, chloroplastic-like isoform X2 [Rhododendron vialii]|uniref:peroxiredoxin Q, chloroplastic-like isoform X2 n=1 Tax=Rhododendron vialii TaxID=182163 RepID=UPI00265D634A|nr:peroxiredoxin Q, chloroplastic-like isoform X2 [Rhododendron vialii]